MFQRFSCGWLQLQLEVRTDCLTTWYISQRCADVWFMHCVIQINGFNGNVSEKIEISMVFDHSSRLNAFSMYPVRLAHKLQLVMESPY